MKTSVVALCVLACTASAFSTANAWEDIVATVNKANAGWVAEVPTRFNSTEDAKALCGTWLKDHPNHVKLPRKPFVGGLSPEDMPAAFDARKQWGGNCTVITKVRDQSSCGSCWAFGSTETFEDRRCIATGQDVEFSTEDTAACCSGFGCGFSMGCNGGQPSAALSWMTQAGVVTGGDYPDIGNGKTCLPYSLKPCAHHVPPSSKYPQCPSQEYPTPRCTRQCSESTYSKSYSDDKTKGQSAYSVQGENDIQNELMKHGPLAVAFTVYADFPTYKSGVYQHVSGGMLGGHAVEMIGWGVENNVPYWWIKNSWNEQWGDQGYFKIKRGNDECGIEDDVTGITF